MDRVPTAQPQSRTALGPLRRVTSLVPSLDRRRLRQAVRALSWFFAALFFAGTKWATEHYLTATLTQGVMAGLASALIIGLVFHLFHHRIEKGIDHLANRRTLARSAALRDLAKEVAFINDRHTLVERVTTNVQCLLETEGAAIYMRHDNATFRRLHATLQAPESVNEDDSAVIQLRRHRTHIPLDNSRSALIGAHLWPILSRDKLLGFLLCGNRLHTESFDDEELSAVFEVVNSLGALLEISDASLGSHTSTGEQHEDHQGIGGTLAHQKLLERTAELHASGVISSFLYQYYGFQSDRDQHLFQLRGLRYPIYVEPGWLSMNRDDSVLAHPLAREEYRIEENDPIKPLKEAYLEYLGTMQRARYDGQTFRLLKASQADGLRLHCGPGSYFNYLVTCESMADELIKKLIEYDVTDRRAFAEHAHLPANRKLLDDLKNDLPNRSLFAPTLDRLARVDTRDSKVGLNIFFACDAEDGPFTLLYHRGKNVAEYPDINHVMPAGTFQHDGRANNLPYDQYEKAYSIKYKVLSEFWEECFEGKGLKTQRKMLYGVRIDFDQAKVEGTDLCPIRDTEELLKEGKAFIYVTGLGIDLLSAKPELTVALIINDKEFSKKYHNHWRFNWEFPGYESDDPYRGVYFLTLRDATKIRELIKPGKVIPAGAMAVERGFELIRQLTRERRMQWDVPEL